VTEAHWPDTLWLIRHGQSEANLISAAAEDAGALEVPLRCRDMDTPLTPLGVQQSDALGRHFARLGESERPNVIIASPYVRTRQTQAALCAHLPEPAPLMLYDERLRERERGVFDGLTRRGVAERLPQEYEKRQFLGKFYHRAPGGESWCDVTQRLRPVVDTVLTRHAGARVMIIAHEVVIYCLRYIIEAMDEAQILAIDAAGDIGNGSITRYDRDDVSGALRLHHFGAGVDLRI
jgi:2,3-bisphosphoglycerate-dependent phosphoglycerate mutase